VRITDVPPEEVPALASRIRRPLVLSLVVSALFVAGGGALAQTADEGQAVFEQKCAGCHTIGGGAKVGPDLKSVSERLGGDAVLEFILAPDQVRPGTTMPNLGLSEAEATALVAYLEAGGGVTPTQPAVTTPPETAPPAPATTDADRGKNLFTGSERLENGGPPCMSCHTVAGIGSLGGGAIGPDLTGSSAKYGQGLPAVLTAVAFPTMRPIYDGQPITAQEAADLAAFLAQAPQAQRSAGAVGKLAGLGIGGAAALVVLGLLFWRRRLVGVRRPLVTRANSRRK